MSFFCGDNYERRGTYDIYRNDDDGKLFYSDLKAMIVILQPCVSNSKNHLSSTLRLKLSKCSAMVNNENNALSNE